MKYIDVKEMEKNVLSDWLTFIASVINALAWPTAIVMIVFSLRRAILRRIPEIRELEVGPLKVKLDKALEEAKEKAEEVKAAPIPIEIEPQDSYSASTANDSNVTVVPHENTTSPRWIDELLLKGEELAKESPEAAVLYAWVETEDAFRRLCERRGFNPRSPLSKNVDFLLRTKAITSEMASLFKDLRRIRNIVAHKQGDMALNVNGAEDYVMSAATLIEAFSKITPPNNN